MPNNVCRMLDLKRKTIDLMLNGEEGDEQDILDMLIEEMAK